MVSFDTETFNGRAKLITCSNGLYIFPKNIDEALTFLWNNTKNYGFFYNIQFDRDAIIKLGIDENGNFCEGIKFVEKTHKNSAFIKTKKFEIILGGNKFFKLRLTNHKTKYKIFYNIANFYKPNGHHITLEQAVSETLGITSFKEDFNIDREKLDKNINYWNENLETIVKYSLKDAYYTEKLYEARKELIKNLLNIDLEFWYSEASVAKAVLEKNLNKLKNSFKIFDKTMRIIIRKSYKGGMITTPQLGKFENVSQIDLKSAYPYAMTLIPDFTKLKWKISKKYHKNAIMGFYEIKMKYNGLFQYRDKKLKEIMYPISAKPLLNFITKPELEYLIEKGIYFEILNSVEGFGKFSPLFKDFIEKLYEAKERYKKEGKLTESWLMKIILNSMYGCFAQSRNGFTKWTNFAIASYITAITRIRLIKEAEKYKNKVIEYSTDALFIKGNADKTKEGKNIGDFEKKHHEEIIVYMNGIRLKKVNDKYEIDASRGFIGLTPELLLNAKGNTLKFEQKDRPLHFLECLRQKRLLDINNFTTIEKTLDLQKNLRKYDFDPEKLKFEILNSSSIKGNYIIVDTNPIFIDSQLLNKIDEENTS